MATSVWPTETLILPSPRLLSIVTFARLLEQSQHPATLGTQPLWYIFGQASFQLRVGRMMDVLEKCRVFCIRHRPTALLSLALVQKTSGSP